MNKSLKYNVRLQFKIGRITRTDYMKFKYDFLNLCKINSEKI